jgi:hypothetical protein
MPEARIERRGRWLYSVLISQGMIGEEIGVLVLGRKRAEKVARRRLACWRLRAERHRDVTVIR